MEQTKWEEVLISWMSGKSFEFVEPRDEIEEVKGREDWQIVDLEALLLKRGLIPEFVCGNDSLYDILLRRMQKQLLYSVNVPPRVQTSTTFEGLMNCRRMLCRMLTTVCSKVSEVSRKKLALISIIITKWRRLKNKFRKGNAVCSTNRMRCESVQKKVFYYFLQR